MSPDVALQSPHDADLGPRPSLEWLPVNQLMVDPSYQRDAASRKSAALIDRIGREFSWQKFQPPVVSPRPDGTYAVVDGQHRVAGARRRGRRELPCYVIATGDVRDEAESFTAINRDRVNMNALQLHHSKVTAGDPEALKVQAVCDEAGVIIARRLVPVADMKPLETQAVRTIARAIKETGVEAPVVDALKALTEAFPDTGGQITAGAIRGLVHFFLWHGQREELDWARLVSVLSDQDIGALEEAATASRALFGGKPYMAFSAAITRAYNRGLRDAAKRLPEHT